MKLTHSERLALYGEILAALLPLKLKTTPPAKGGQAKPANWSFATACWARKVLQTAEWVLENEERTEREPETRAGGPVDDVPF